METQLSRHLARVRHLRESFAAANERLVARLRQATDDSAERVPAEGWSAAQIGWHVSAVSTRFAGLISGDLQGAQPLPEDFRERPWPEVAAGIPEQLRAPATFEPPRAVRRAAAIAALEASGVRMARAFDTLTPERGERLGVTSPIVGSITVYQIGEWATAHIIRHNKQAKGLLAADS